MSSQIYFSNDDPLGVRANNTKLYDQIGYMKNREAKHITWGSNDDIDNARIFPRGKAYWKLFDIQIQNHIKFA